MTHLLKLLNKICKYEMDVMSIVEDTERWNGSDEYCWRYRADMILDRQTDGQTDRQSKTSIPPFNFEVEAGWGITSTYLFYRVNIMGVDVQEIQGARASAAMIFTMLNPINSVPAHFWVNILLWCCGTGNFNHIIQAASPTASLSTWNNPA